MSGPGLLIGLTGHAGAGKDTVAAMLQAAGWGGIALADGLRLEVADAWRIDIGQLTDRTRKELATPALAAGGPTSREWQRWVYQQGHSLSMPRSPRWVLQQWGSMRRAADPHHWVRPVLYWVQHQRQRGVHHLVVSDVRLANEALALRGHGGHIVRVHRPDLATLPPDTARHESEGHTALRADADIHNDSSMPALNAEVWRVVQLLSNATPA